MQEAHEKKNTPRKLRHPERSHSRSSVQNGSGQMVLEAVVAEPWNSTEDREDNAAVQEHRQQNESFFPLHWYSIHEYSKLYEHAPASYFILDSQGTIHYANPAGAFLLAEDPASLPGKNIEEFVVDSQRQPLSNYLIRCAEQKESRSVELMLKPGHGEQIVQMTSTAVRKNGDVLLRTMIISAYERTYTGNSKRKPAQYDLGEAVRGIQQQMKDAGQQGRQKKNHLSEPATADTTQREKADESSTPSVLYMQLQKELSSKNRLLTSMALSEIKSHESIADWEKQLREMILFPPSHLKKLVLGVLQEMRQYLKDNMHPLEQYINRMDQEFFATLANRHPTLTPAEIRLCGLLRLDLTTKEIAQILHTSEKTVENQRYRLRRKFGLPREKNLTTFLVAL